MLETIAIRNPRIRELVVDEQKNGAGRNATEAAENLIRDGIEWRRIQKAQASQTPPPVIEPSQSAASAA